MNGRRGNPWPAEIVEEAIRLRREGWLLREVSERLGVPKSTISQWSLDPDGTIAAARRERYAGTCADCGARTYNGTSIPPEKCIRCWYAVQAEPQTRIALADRATARAMRWPDSYLLDSLRRAAELAGGRLSCPFYRRLEREQPFEEPLPCSATIMNRFGGWSAALEAAGLPTNGSLREYTRLSAEDCLRAVALLGGELGHVPSFSEYERAARQRDDLPSGALVRVRCGSWGAVLKALVPTEDVAA